MFTVLNREVELRGKQKTIEVKQPMSELETAPIETLSKSQMQRLIAGLKRERVSIKEQLSEAREQIDKMELFEKEKYDHDRSTVALGPRY
jgi:hypothetical protein